MTWGKAQWEGTADAALSVAVQLTRTSLVLRMRVADDKQIRPSGSEPRTMVRADHVEIGWEDKRDGDNTDRVQMAVAEDEQGGLRTTWFIAPKQAVAAERPKATREEGEGISVELPLTWLNWDEHGMTRVEVSFSDSDDTAKGQQTLVSIAARVLKSEDGELYPLLDQDFAPWMKVTGGEPLVEWLRQQ